MLAGAMDELQVGDPAWLATDVGPVIDADARGALETARAAIAQGRRGSIAAGSPGPRRRHFLAPLAVEIDSIDALEREVFGPIIHVLRYRSDRLEALVDAINATGYGLTLRHPHAHRRTARSRARVTRATSTSTAT